MTPKEIHDKAEAARSLMEGMLATTFCTAYERKRAEKVLSILKEIEEGTQ